MGLTQTLEGKWRATQLQGDLLRGDASQPCDIPVQGLIGLIKYSWGWVTDREVIPGCARVRTKCAEKTCVGL